MDAALADAISSLPPALASERDRSLLARLTAAIPGVAEPFGFECRLSRGGHPVDFGFAIAAEGAEAVLGEETGGNADAWSRTRAFARRWRADPALRRWIPFSFLEFDAAPAALPAPSLFAALDSPLTAGAGPAPELEAALAVVALLAGENAGDAASAVRRAHASLPRGGRFLHVGVLSGRPGRSVRLSVLLAGAAMPAYLAALGARDAAAAARRALDAFAPQLATAQLDFDCGPPVAARIGIGVRPDPAGGLVETLAARAGASRERIDALATWEGPLATADGWRRRRVSHLKLVCTPEAVAEAKAYLEVGRPSRSS